MRHAWIAVVAVAALSGPAAAAEMDGAIGLWANPKNTIAVKTGPCGRRLCGTIVRASDVARADAKDAGVDPLIGTELLQDYRPTGRGTWSGRVYVPDMGRSFSSKIVQLSPDQLKISGCLLGGFFCKSQLWHRIR